MSRLFFLLISLMLIAYPLIVYLSIDEFSPRVLGVILLVLISLRFIFARINLNQKNLRFIIPVTAVSILLSGGIIFSDDALLVKLYPVVVNAALLAVFLYTLFNPPSMIERIARIKEPELPIEGVIYTRQVTIAWCLMFVFNGLMGLYTAIWTSVEFWTLYNGLIAYLLIGILFATEFVIRQYLKAQH